MKESHSSLNVENVAKAIRGSNGTAEAAEVDALDEQAVNEGFRTKS